MSVKCVHRGCGKLFDPLASDECNYHPDPPEFHEGQKGWKCCKPRVLTFDEFMTIPPCTKGTHSAKDEAAIAEEQKAREASAAALAALSISSQSSTAPAQPPTSSIPTPAPPPPPPPPPEDESDDPDARPAEKAACKRRGCDAVYTSTSAGQAPSPCVHHPGQALFHEGSKGYTCCKRRVLEFDQFLKIPGCKEKSRHCFVGRKKDPDAVEQVTNVRHDFYQTGRSVIASLYLKKVDKSSSTITFSSSTTIDVDLSTTDNKSYRQTIPLFAPIDTDNSTYKVLGTKIEFDLVKADGTNWAVLRSDDRPTGEIIQTGRAARV